MLLNNNKTSNKLMSYILANMIELLNYDIEYK